MVEIWADPGDRLLARTVFGTGDREEVHRLILDWTAKHGFGQAHVSAIELSVGAAVTITLADLTKIFLKVWPEATDARRLAAQMKVQEIMAAHGFPAPTILSKLSALGSGWAASMEYNRSGVPTDVTAPGVRRAMAVGLARFVAEADASQDVENLPERLLPAAPAIWPEPHNVLFDFGATVRGAEWIDQVARQTLSVMRSAESGIVLGHHDWSAKNMRMGPSGIAVVYDWDSVFLDREAFILGSAAANFPITWELDVSETPAPGEVVAFVREYEQARGTAFTQSELAQVEAGATYARAYKARCEHAIDPRSLRWRGSSRESLEANGPYRFDRVVHPTCRRQ